MTRYILLSVLMVRAASAADLLPGGFVAPAKDAPAPKLPGRTQLRGVANYKLIAEPDKRIRLTVRGIRVGKYEGAVDVVVRDALGAVVAKDSVPVGQAKVIEFISPGSAGPITIDCQAGRNAVAVTTEGGRLLIPAGDLAIRIVGQANPLYFYVEKGIREFPLHLSGQGKAETARAIVRDPKGRSVADVSTVAEPVRSVKIRVPLNTDGKVWSVHLTKAERGVFEDVSLKLPTGVGPFVAERPGDVVVPAVRLDAAMLVRPEDRRSFRARACVADVLVKHFGDLCLSVVDSTGKLVCSKTFRPESRRTWNAAERLDVGNYRLRLSCKSGDQVIAVEQGLYVVDRPRTLTNDKTVLADGKPFFARGLYHVQTKDYERVKAQGFNVVQAQPVQIKDCERVGLKAAVMLYGGMRVRPDYYRKMLLRYRQSPAVVCWMTMDEPSAHGVPLELMARGYATIREVSEQPAYTCICRPSAYDDYGRSADVIAIDVYPVGRGPLTAISDALEIAKTSVPDHTIWFIGQVWSWPDTRLVTPDEHRCMTYLALTHANVRGLFWYSFRDPNWYLPESNKPVWEMCGRVNRELVALEPVLITNNVWERVEKDGQGEVHLAAKVHNKKLYIIATNPTDRPADLNLDLRPDHVTGPVTEIFEKRTVKLTDDHIKERFEPLDTRVYTINRRRYRQEALP